MILQACNYYEKIDSEHWTSPLLTALRENKRIPLTTSEGSTYLESADVFMMDHYTCVDYMIDFGVKKEDYMEVIWELSAQAAKVTKSHVDMKATMEAIRGKVTETKRSKL